MSDHLILYRKHANGVGTWRIWAEGDHIHIAHATTLDGQEVRHLERVTVNNSGRTLDEQVQLRIRSRTSRMLDKGYKHSLQEAQNSSTNQMGLDRPMLAHPIERVKNVNYSGAVLQKKLDGHRCLVTNRDGEIIAYTRQGKPIPSIGHITDALSGRLPEGTTLDGELYCHSVALQTLGSWIKREQPATRNLFYVVYDTISPDAYRQRHEEITGLLSGIDTGVPGKVVVLPYEDYRDPEHTSGRLTAVRDAGFEGLMLRLDGRGYETGRRSSSLLKIKRFLDGEFEVVGFSQSSTGWAVCRCITEDGKAFDASAPGSHQEKQHVWDNQSLYLGRWLTVEFAHWTDDGLPFQPTATRWREDL